MFLEIALAANLFFAQEPFKYTRSDEQNNIASSITFKEKTEESVLTVQENKITWTEYCKAVEKETQTKLGADFVVAYRPTQKPKFPVKLGGRFDLEKQVFIIDVLVDDPAEQKK